MAQAINRKASEAANAMVRARGVPDGAETAIESRHLLQRMVDYMLGQGVRQFLDLGSGLPNMANTHQIAHRTAPEARMHVKRIINDNYGKPDRMSMDWSVFRGPEAREGMTAFAEKRSPSWIPEALRSGKRL